MNFEHLVASLRRRHIEAGSLPPERQLADELNINRHQLRKALFRLRETGELGQTRGRRPMVPSTLPRFGEELLRLTNPLEVLEFRMVAEPGLARLASLRASPVEISRILELAHTDKGADSGEVDLQFHFAVVRAAHNHLAEEIYRTMRQVGYDSRMRVPCASSGTCPKRIAQRDAEHLRVAEAIARRDPEAAGTAMRAHLASVYNRVNQLSTAGSAFG
jgi:DNA-binding FadR family transcriptional regulator